MGTTIGTSRKKKTDKQKLRKSSFWNFHCNEKKIGKNFMTKIWDIPYQRL